MGPYDQIGTAANMVAQCTYQDQTTAPPISWFLSVTPIQRTLLHVPSQTALDEASRVQLQSRRNVPMYGVSAMQLR